MFIILSVLAFLGIDILWDRGFVKKMHNKIVKRANSIVTSNIP